MNRLTFAGLEGQPASPSTLGQVISVEDWSKWQKRDRCKIAGKPSIDFLIELEIMLERQFGLEPGSIDLEGDQSLWGKILFPFDPVGPPVALEQIIRDFDRCWPPGKGFVIALLSDGRKEAIIRDADGDTHYFWEPEITFEGTRATLSSIYELTEKAFAVGTLSAEFTQINGYFLKQAAALSPAKGGPVSEPIIVVPVLTRRPLHPVVRLPQRPVAVRTPEAWFKLQAAATAAGINPMVVMVFGLDGQRFTFPLYS